MSCTATTILECENGGCPDHDLETGIWIDSVARWSAGGSTPEQIAKDLGIPVEMVTPHLQTSEEAKAKREAFQDQRSAMITTLYSMGQYTQVEIADQLNISQAVVAYHLARQRETEPNTVREKFGRLTRETQDLGAILKAAAFGAPLVSSRIEVGYPVCPEDLRDPLGVVASAATVRGMVMGARTFADMRVFGRDVLEIETIAAKLKADLYARLWDVPLFVIRPIDASIWIVGQCDDGSWVRQEVVPKPEPADDRIRFRI